MATHPIPLVIEDVSQFAQRLRANWPEDPPGQAKTLALVARAAGYQNHQTLRAQLAPEGSDPPLTPVETRRLRDALRVFDAQGIMTRWPLKTSVQALCLAAFWSALPARKDMTEAEVNAALKTGESFGDHVLIRRSLIEHKMAQREREGSNYRRIERRPTALERQLIRAISERRLSRF